MSEISQKPPVPFKKIKSDDYDDGQVVMTIAGTITKLYPPKKGDTYEYQNGVMKDSDGTEIDISFSKNTQPVETAKGKRVTIRSVKSEQHGWNGIKVNDQSFTPQGETEAVQKRVLKITASADITYEGGGAASGKSQPASTGTASGGNTSKQQTHSQPSMHPKVFLANAGALHKACHDTSIGLYGGMDSPDMDLIRTCTASLFIEACRNGYAHDFEEQIAKAVPPKITPPPEDPKLWKSCMIPKGANIGKTLDKLTEEEFTKYYDFYLDKEETPFTRCIMAGFAELGYLKKRQDALAAQKEADAALEPAAQDDVPF